MKELPKVFANKIKNNKNVDHVSNNNTKKDINKEIDLLFKDKELYKKDVIITIDKDYVKRVLLRKDDYLITMQNEKIKISDIKDIKYK